MVVKCDKCPYTAKFSYMIRDHQLVHSDVRAWKCKFPGCSLSYKWKQNFMKHRVSHEKNLESRKSYHCKFNSCRHRFISKANLKVHIASRHSARTARAFPCSLCPKNFFDENVLKIHTQTHVRTRRPKDLRLSCEYCDFRTYSEESHSQHLRIIHGKPMKRFCAIPDCKFSTAYSDSWAEHVRGHDTDPQVRRPFPSSVPGCDFRASNKGNVKQHFRAPHKEDRAKDVTCSLG